MTTKPAHDAVIQEPTYDVTASLRVDGDDDYPTGPVASPSRTRL